MIRDFRLAVILDEDQQLPFEIELLAIDLHRAVRSLRGTIWQREIRGLFIAWEFSTYQDARSVRTRLNAILGREPRWYLQSESRLEYGNLTRSEIDSLLDFTDFAGEASA